MVERGFIGKMLPKEGMKVVAEKMADQSKETTVMSLSYDGDNISSLTTGSNVFSYSDYDTYSNIWFNFFPFSAYEADANSQIFSKNNPGKVVSQMGSINIPTTFIYTYDGNVPATIQANTTFMGTSSAKTTRFVYN